MEDLAIGVVVRSYLQALGCQTRQPVSRCYSHEFSLMSAKTGSLKDESVENLLLMRLNVGEAAGLRGRNGRFSTNVRM